MAILVIDDCKDTQALIKKYLENDCDTDIRSAYSGSEGIQALTTDVDLILLDILMPNKDGIETCKEIKNMPLYKDIPIIFVTQYNEIEVLEKAFAAGAADFIRKPLHPIELRARVCAMMQLSKEMKSRKANEAVLKKLSMVDGLTGIANRRYFDQMMEREWKLALRNDVPLSIILFDVDCFKDYNDFYGHILGDEALIAIAATASNQLKRPADNVFRYGGEEFIVLLPATQASGAYAVAEDIRKAVEGLRLPHSRSSVSDVLTISLGISELAKPQVGSFTMLINQADAALYHAKDSGRNQTVLFKEGHMHCSFISKTCNQ